MCIFICMRARVIGLPFLLSTAVLITVYVTFTTPILSHVSEWQYSDSFKLSVMASRQLQAFTDYDVAESKTQLVSTLNGWQEQLHEILLPPPPEKRRNQLSLATYSKSFYFVKSTYFIFVRE